MLVVVLHFILVLTCRFGTEELGVVGYIVYWWHTNVIHCTTFGNKRGANTASNILGSVR